MSDIDEHIANMEVTQPLPKRERVKLTLIGAMMHWHARASVASVIELAKSRYKHGTPTLADWLAHNEQSTRS